MINFIKYKLYFAFIFFIVFNLHAAEIKEIQIKGNKRVSAETIKVYGGFNIGENIDEKKINEILNNLYSTNFFENVEINEVNGVLEVLIDEYPIVNQLIIDGEPSKRIKESIEDLISTKKDNPS